MIDLIIKKGLQIKSNKMVLLQSFIIPVSEPPRPRNDLESILKAKNKPQQKSNIAVTRPVFPSLLRAFSRYAAAPLSRPWAW